MFDTKLIFSIDIVKWIQTFKEKKNRGIEQIFLFSNTNMYYSEYL